MTEQLQVPEQVVKHQEAPFRMAPFPSKETLTLKRKKSPFDGMEVPIFPGPRGLVNVIYDPKRGKWVVSPLKIFDKARWEATGSALGEARDLWRPKERRLIKGDLKIGDVSVKKVLAGLKKLWTDTPSKMAIELFGRGGFTYKTLGVLADFLKEKAARLGINWPGQGVPLAIVGFVRELPKFWETRIKRGEIDKNDPGVVFVTGKESLSYSDCPPLKEFKEKGYDPALVLQAKYLERHAKILQEASGVFNYLYKKRFKKPFNLEKAKEDEIDKVLSDFHGLDESNISTIFSKLGKANEESIQHYGKEDYLQVFKRVLGKEKLEVIDLTQKGTRYLGFCYKGFRFLLPYLRVDEKGCRAINFTTALVYMEKAKQIVEERLAELEEASGTDQWLKERRKFDAVYEELRWDKQKLFKDGFFSPSNRKLKKYLKSRVHSGVTDHQLDEVVGDLRSWVDADLYLSVGSLNSEVRPFDPSTMEMDGGLGSGIHLDVSPRSGKGVWQINLNNVHEIIDGEGAVKYLNRVLEDVLEGLGRELEPTERRKVLAKIALNGKSPELTQVNLGWHPRFIKDGRYIPGKSLSLFKNPGVWVPRQSFKRTQFPHGLFQVRSRELSEEFLEDLRKSSVGDTVQERQKAIDTAYAEKDYERLLRLMEEEIGGLFNGVVLDDSRRLFESRWEAKLEDDERVKDLINNHKLRELYELKKNLWNECIREVSEEENYQWFGDFEADINEVREKLVEVEKYKRKLTANDYEEGLTRQQIEQAKNYLEKYIADQTLKMAFRIKRDVVPQRREIDTIVKKYEELKLGRITTFGVNACSRLIYEMWARRNPVTQIPIGREGSQRLVVNYLTADQATGDRFRAALKTLNQSEVSLEEIEHVWRGVTQAVMYTAGIVWRIKQFRAENNMGNPSLITGGAGELREESLKMISNVTNPVVASFFYSRDMVSMINGKDSPLVDVFSTSLTPQVSEMVEGMIRSPESTTVVYRAKTEVFINQAISELQTEGTLPKGINWKKANQKQKNIIKQRMEEVKDSHFKAQTMSKLFVCTLVDLTQESIKDYYEQWNKINSSSKNINYQDSFLNFLVRTRAKKLDLDIDLSEFDFSQMTL